jgi:Ribbon-helix-helix domain
VGGPWYTAPFEGVTVHPPALPEVFDFSILTKFAHVEARFFGHKHRGKRFLTRAHTFVLEKHVRRSGAVELSIASKRRRILRMSYVAVTYKIREDQRDRLQKISDVTKVSQAEIVRQALDDFLARNEGIIIDRTPIFVRGIHVKQDTL